MGKMPPLATGDVIEDYEPLFIYWRKAREKGREDLIEKTLITEEDLSLLKDLVERSKLMSLDELLNTLLNYLKERVDPEVAKESLSSYGLNLGVEEAREFIARILAGWLIEAGQLRLILKFKRSWNVSEA